MRFDDWFNPQKGCYDPPMKQIENVLTDKGSKYAVSGGAVTSRTEAANFIKELKRKKKFAKATHNTWAVIFADGEQVKNDDGESGAGALILQMLERAELRDHIIVVTRWYGGVHLGGDRFRHVKTCVQAYLDEA
jgi:putative IMPACT (imprinted ancient) family translation regulator